MIFESFLLGIIQGIAEFLPISSSGHLVLAKSILSGFSESGLVFDIFLHAGTLVAVIVYYNRDLRDLAFNSINRQKTVNAEFTPEQARIMLLGIIIATIPVVFVGLFFEKYLEKYLGSPFIVSCFLCLTGIILFAGEFFAGKRSSGTDPHKSIQIWKWFLVGLAQAFALFPGISRSGATIACGLALGWSRPAAARFSFFLMIPAVSGAVCLKLIKLISGFEHLSIGWVQICIGTLTAAVSGYLAIGILVNFIRNRKLYPFGIYCLAAGILSLMISLFY